MCGLFGAQWKVRPKDVALGKLYTLLSAANDKRGGQSWGVWTPEKGRRRGMGALAEGIPVEAMESNTLMAHSRWATHGAKNKDNCHPFKVGNIVGAHNGVIYNHKELNEKYRRKFEVDSQHIFAHLDAGLPLDDLEGYGTIEWYDKRAPGRVNLCKLTPSGDLRVVVVKGFGVVWNSDDRALCDALRACKLDYTLMKTEPHVYYFVEEGAYWQNPDVKYAVQSRKVNPVTSGGGRSYYGYGWGLDSDDGHGTYGLVQWMKDKEERKAKAEEKVVGFTTSDGGTKEPPKADEATADGTIKVHGNEVFEKKDGLWIKLEDEEEIGGSEVEVVTDDIDGAVYADILRDAELDNLKWEEDPTLDMLLQDDLTHYRAVMQGLRAPDRMFADIVEYLDQVRDETRKVVEVA